MLEIREKLNETQPHQHTLTLSFDLRQRSRLRVTLEDGREAAVFLERGCVLRNGDLLRASDGRVVRVRAAAETVSVVRSGDSLLLARAAYHLGNRHVPLEIRAGELAYQHDHVLDGMLRDLGLSVALEQRPFEPEAGAYAGHRHSHSSDAHDRGAVHAQEDGPGGDHARAGDE